MRELTAACVDVEVGEGDMGDHVNEGAMGVGECAKCLFEEEGAATSGAGSRHVASHHELRHRSQQHHTNCRE